MVGAEEVIEVSKVADEDVNASKVEADVASVEEEELDWPL